MKTPLPLVLFLTSTLPLAADTIVKNDVTATLGPDFFLDAASTGGQDLTSADVTFIRDFGTLNFNPSGTFVKISGVGWAAAAGGTNATSVTVRVTYLGNDSVVGGGDDVLIGTVTDAITFDGAGEYAWKFATPLAAAIAGTGTSFSLRFTGVGGTLRFKATATPRQRRDHQNQRRRHVRHCCRTRHRRGWPV